MIRRSIPAMVLALAVLAPSFCAHAESWEERMWRQVHKKVAFELIDTKLSEACDLLTSLTGLNIILSPAVRQKDPTFSLKIQDMDAGTALKWFTQLTDTYADLVDQAIYITDKPPKKAIEEEKAALMELGAKHGIVVELPPEGQALTDQERVKIALQIMEKEELKVQDFPGPDVSLGAAEKGTGFAFEAPGKK